MIFPVVSSLTFSSHLLSTCINKFGRNLFALTHTMYLPMSQNPSLEIYFNSSQFQTLYICLKVYRMIDAIIWFFPQIFQEFISSTDNLLDKSNSNSWKEAKNQVLLWGKWKKHVVMSEKLGAVLLGKKEV